LSWLRASRKVVDPKGIAWDVYVTRVHGGPWRARDTGGWQGPSDGESFLLWLVLLPLLVVFELVRLVLRLLALVPITIVRTVAGGRLRIEAIADWPQPRKYAWEIEPRMRERMLDEIAGALERGSIARPAGAVFLGELEQ
jgi:hypothetical protein